MNSPGCKPVAGLYMIATPIGNRGDITLRALHILAQADVIACEDTRNSRPLFDSYGIRASLLSYHDHNEGERAPELIKKIQDGNVVALISDAGMPGIADPGFRLARACRAEGLPVTVIPGANAALTAMAGSGLATDRFFFAGFLPPKSTTRCKELATLKNIAATLVFYESPQRLADSLADMVAVLGDNRRAAVARELTKLFEETRLGGLVQLADYYAAHEVKGEIVILVERGAEEKSTVDLDVVLTELLKKLSLRDAVAEAVAATGLPKKEVYARALALPSTIIDD